jgi:hypothetical protein
MATPRIIARNAVNLRRYKFVLSSSGTVAKAVIDWFTESIKNVAAKNKNNLSDVLYQNFTKNSPAVKNDITITPETNVSMGSFPLPNKACDER